MNVNSAGGLNPPGASHSDSSALSLQLVTNYSSGFPVLALAPWELYASGFLFQYLVILCSHLSVSPTWRDSGLPCDLTFLMNLKVVVDFSICSAFYL